MQLNISFHYICKNDVTMTAAVSIRDFRANQSKLIQTVSKMSDFKRFFLFLPLMLVAGLCGCEKNLVPEIDLADNLEGSWEKVYPEVSGDSEEKYIYQEHQNGYPGVGSSTPEIYLFEIDHDFMQEDRKAAYTPAARYYVKECSKDKLVLTREEVNVDGPNLIEGDVTFRRMGLYTK